jgi:hypothetical protein
MIISQAGDGLRDIRKEWPSSWMIGQCQMPSGNENRRSNHMSERPRSKDHTRAGPLGSSMVSVPVVACGASNRIAGPEQLG